MIRRILAVIRLRRARVRSRQQLKELDNHLLKDIGLGTRLLVPKSRFDEVKRALVDTMPAFPVGDPADPKTAVGPMVSQKQYEGVQSYIRNGIKEGAEVLVGGEGRPEGLEAGYFVKPTVFINVKND